MPELARSAAAEGTPQTIRLQPPFSNFDFVDQNYGAGNPALRRLFSQARSLGCRTLVVEDIGPEGAVLDEIEDLRRLDSGYRCESLQRLTFWKPDLGNPPLSPRTSSRSLAGYAIVKRDVLPTLGHERVHVFESVFRKYPHRHNCVPGTRRFELRCLGRRVSVPGVMFCQQNGLTKSCAQVALRTILTHLDPTRDYPYSAINRIARTSRTRFNPAKGLDSDQISQVLQSHGLQLAEISYEQRGIVATLPYGKWLYSAIESGQCGLLGFQLAGTEARGQRHIVPFFGHTFNQDTWAPRAIGAYFKVGENLRFISSMEWMSSFLGHDDNFGSNYCFPRSFIDPDNVKYVATVRPPNCRYDATIAESIAIGYLASGYLRELLRRASSVWARRLYEHMVREEVVLRAVAVTNRKYIKALRNARDWEGQSENEKVVQAVESFLPESLWLVEVSVPELFGTNLRRIGEVVLDSQLPSIPPADSHHLVMIRLPETYLFPTGRFPAVAEFFRLPSRLAGHVELFGQ